MKKLIGALSILIILCSCKTGKNTTEEYTMTQILAVQQVIIYKTTGDFSRLVPVIMNGERTQIVSYPAPTDLVYQGKPALPVSLADGYLLDNRGIQPNVVFTSFTYEEYAALSVAPTMDELMKKIVEKYPLTEMYYCGRRDNFRDINELNKLINDGFPNCQKADIQPMQVIF